jgi:UDP-glucose 4-epimerase
VVAAPARPTVRVLVTGGAGFIGANLCARLCALDEVDSVVVLDDLTTGNKDDLSGVPIALVVGSVLDESLLREVAKGADAIVHLGARRSVVRSLVEPVDAHDVNATGTVRVLEAARDLDDPLVVVASSSSVYGANTTLPMHETLAPMPISPYAVSKLAAEQYAAAWQRCFGVRTLALRLFNVYGPGQPADHPYATVIPTFVAAALAGRPLPVEGDGRQSRDFTYVDTVCDAIVAALRRGVSSPTPVNVAAGASTTIVELVALIGELLGRRPSIGWRPGRVGDIWNSQAALDRFRQLFPEIAPVDLPTGLERTIAWSQGR